MENNFFMRKTDKFYTEFKDFLFETRNYFQVFNNFHSNSMEPFDAN